MREQSGNKKRDRNFIAKISCLPDASFTHSFLERMSKKKIKSLNSVVLEIILVSCLQKFF